MDPPGDTDHLQTAFLNWLLTHDNFWKAHRSWFGHFCVGWDKSGFELYSWCKRKLQCPYPSAAGLSRDPFLLLSGPEELVHNFTKSERQNWEGFFLHYDKLFGNFGHFSDPDNTKVPIMLISGTNPMQWQKCFQIFYCAWRQKWLNSVDWSF